MGWGRGGVVPRGWPGGGPGGGVGWGGSPGTGWGGVASQAGARRAASPCLMVAGLSFPGLLDLNRRTIATMGR